MIREVQFDGLVGPSHHFGGLGVGNVASQAHAGAIARPKSAALQGLDKLSRVARMGIPQGILPPPLRPHFTWLRSLGFEGDECGLLRQAMERSPESLSAACSASSMWVANAATMSCGTDTQDRRIHCTIANLTSSRHRSLEAQERFRMFDGLFNEPSRFQVHEPLQDSWSLRDEGAANHMRLCGLDGREGFNLFVYGDDSNTELDARRDDSQRFVARQSRRACETIARQHGLNPSRTYYLKQHPVAIQAGAFHNDVVATSYRHLVLHHELAFLGGESTWQAIERDYREVTNQPLYRCVIRDDELSLQDAIDTYLFNSQILPTGDEDDPSLCLLAPSQCRDHPRVQAVIERLLGDNNPLVSVEYVELRESMNNGGGPACLRLRVDLNDADRARLPIFCWWSERIDARLRDCICRLYPESQSLADLVDPVRIEQWRAATESIYRALGWPMPQSLG